MAFKFSKAQRAELNSFRDRLDKEYIDLTGTLEEQAEVIGAAYERLNGAIDTYNGVLANARSYIEDIASEAESEFEDKSENWQSGERGEIVREWIDAIDNAVSEMEDGEQFTFEGIGLEVPDHGGLIDNLEDEPSY
jgi:hypothetical protein